MAGQVEHLRTPEIIPESMCLFAPSNRRLCSRDYVICVGKYSPGNDLAKIISSSGWGVNGDKGIGSIKSSTTLVNCVCALGGRDPPAPARMLIYKGSNNTNNAGSVPSATISTNWNHIPCVRKAGAKLLLFTWVCPSTHPNQHYPLALALTLILVLGMQKKIHANSYIHTTNTYR